MSQNRPDYSLKRIHKVSNLRDHSPRNPVSAEPKDLASAVLELFGDQSPHDIVKYEKPEILLPLLSYLIINFSEDPDVGSLEKIKDFFEFARSCRRSAKPVQIIRSLPQVTAAGYHRLISTFLGIIDDDGRSLKVLKFIFHRELKIPEYMPATEELVLDVIADLPFSLGDSWVNVWTGLAQAIWGGIWDTTLFLRRLEMGEVLGKDLQWREGEENWARREIALQAGVVGIGSNRRSEGHDEELEPSIPVPSQNCESPKKDKGLEKYKDHEGDDQDPKSPVQVSKSAVGSRRVPERVSRPQKIYYSPPAPKPAISMIDIIVSKYAELPRLKWNEKEFFRQELARQQKSEEEFNERLKRSYNEERLRERLEELAATGLLGKDASYGGIENIFSGNEELITCEFKEEQQIEELVALHRRIVDQDREIEDEEFERWATKLLEEGRH